MRKPQRVALVGAGKFTDSPLTRWRSLGDQLGPVKAASLRVASRIANSLRAGHAVSDYQEFEDCTLILISVPDDLLHSMVAELAAAPLTWTEKVVVVCSESAGCDQLRILADLGAATGSLAAIPGHEDRWFLLEGDKVVERCIRTMIADRDVRVTVIGCSLKRHYLDGLAFAGAQFLPYLKESSEALKRAGVGNAEVSAIVERQLTRTMRSFFRSGKG